MMVLGNPYMIGIESNPSYEKMRPKTKMNCKTNLRQQSNNLAIPGVKKTAFILMLSLRRAKGSVLNSRVYSATLNLLVRIYTLSKSTKH